MNSLNTMARGLRDAGTNAAASAWGRLWC